MNLLYDNIKETTMMKALIELDEYLKSVGSSPIDIDIVGGFALMARGIRTDKNQITDIDYVGASFPKEYTPAIEKIGEKYSLGKDWINNDLVLDNSTMEDFSFTTGELNFDNAVSLSVIRVNILQEQDLLRLKILALDTAMCAQELGGDFTRMKDFSDVVALKEKLDLPLEAIEDMCEPFLLSMDVFDMIEVYELGGENAVCEYLADRQMDLNLDESIDDFLRDISERERDMDYDF